MSDFTLILSDIYSIAFCYVPHCFACV